MTEEEALSAVKAARSNPNVAFIAARKIDPTSGSIEVARESEAVARRQNVGLYHNGIFLDILRSGGYVVLEFDRSSQVATRIDIVAAERVNPVNIESEKIEGDLNRNLAVQILSRSEEFSDGFFGSEPSVSKVSLHSFVESNTPTPSSSGATGYFAIPERLTSIAATPDELLELRALLSSIQLWPVRHSVLFPIFAASPNTAVNLARKELTVLEEQFAHNTGQQSDFADHLVDLSSIDNHDQLTQRIRRLTDFNDFLIQQSAVKTDTKTIAANVTVATIPLFLGVDKSRQNDAFGTMNASGLISTWVRTEGGDLKLKGLGEGD